MLQLSSIELTHKLFSGPSEWIPAMNKVKQIVAEANFSNRAFPVGNEYASWETDEVIELEFWRNMGLSLLCVFITTLVLIQNLPACVIVLVCVLLTLVNVGGSVNIILFIFMKINQIFLVSFTSGASPSTLSAASTSSSRSVSVLTTALTSLTTLWSRLAPQT